MKDKKSESEAEGHQMPNILYVFAYTDGTRTWYEAKDSVVAIKKEHNTPLGVYRLERLASVYVDIRCRG